MQKWLPSRADLNMALNELPAWLWALKGRSSIGWSAEARLLLPLRADVTVSAEFMTWKSHKGKNLDCSHGVHTHTHTHLIPAVWIIKSFSTQRFMPLDIHLVFGSHTLDQTALSLGIEYRYTLQPLQTTFTPLSYPGPRHMFSLNLFSHPCKGLYCCSYGWVGR